MRKPSRPCAWTVVVFTSCVLVYAIGMQDSSIYEMVAGAYQVPLVGAFVPLVCGLYWKRATTQGALLAVALGLGVWLTSTSCPAGPTSSRNNWPV